MFSRRMAWLGGSETALLTCLAPWWEQLKGSAGTVTWSTHVADHVDSPAGWPQDSGISYVAAQGSKGKCSTIKTDTPWPLATEAQKSLGSASTHSVGHSHHEPTQVEGELLNGRCIKESAVLGRLGGSVG